MKGLGTGENGQLTFIDYLAIFSLWIAMENYGMNLTQDDKQDLQKALSDKTTELLNEIHNHLAEQDRKIDLILEELHGNHQTFRGPN